MMNQSAEPPRMRINAQIAPRGTLEVLSQMDVAALTDTARRIDLMDVFRRCALAVLNTGNETDDAKALFDTYADFSIEVVRRTRGLKLVIRNAPPSAFVAGRMVEGIREHLFSLLRDIVFIGTEYSELLSAEDLAPAVVTDAVFQILKHARVLEPNKPPNLVVCWGGHSISREEYEYTKEVGYHLGLRGLDICTGCGPGAMKGPMKGAAVGHAKQRITEGRYIGLSEPGIIAAEPPNPMVNHLVVLPDIEKRLEAFVRLGHAVLVFPGGVGTAEEIFYLLGIVTDPKNAERPLPLVFTGPAGSEAYFAELDRFLRRVLGDDIASYYRIIVGNAEAVGEHIDTCMRRIRTQRRRDGDAYYFNWLLSIPSEHQKPFQVSHESVAALRLSRDLPRHTLIAELRRAFSAIVTGNVKENGIRMIEERGPFVLASDQELVVALDQLLTQFVRQGRMRLIGEYKPCFRVVPA
jgi:predicted Rossmann-fold nucleotide-binding protein